MNTVSVILLIIWIIVILMILGTLAYGGILAAPFVPMWKKDVRRALKLAEIKPGEKLYDLGSGDGRFIIEATRQYGADSTGFEVALLPYIYSYVKIILIGLNGKTRVKMRNFYEYNLQDADIVTAFLSTRAMTKLKDKFEKELKPGARVISLVFGISGWKANIIDRPTSKDLPIYSYTIK